VVKAPFNAVVQRRAVDQGQIIGPSSPVITLVGTDTFWVQISVPIERLAWFDIPGLGGATQGSNATIWRELNGERIERKGRVIRLMTDVDPLGRMARVLVEIDDPLGLRDERAAASPETKPSIPFLVGAFVQVDVHGRTVGDVFELPRQPLRNGSSVYVMKPEHLTMNDQMKNFFWWATDRELAELETVHRLETRPVTVVWRQRDAVLVRTDLAPGERIVTSAVPAAIEGMKLRLAEPIAPGDKTAAATAPSTVDAAPRAATESRQ
jgi:multidrug efflux pump subunit AcrA (membrane-fusion protein)